MANLIKWSCLAYLLSASCQPYFHSYCCSTLTPMWPVPVVSGRVTRINLTSDKDIPVRPLSAALLDLPVQPSATEVLGFSQTANASPSALPFRFYEQSRRAPNDPTASRSVFASVDKVPGKRGFNFKFGIQSQTPAAMTETLEPGNVRNTLKKSRALLTHAHMSHLGFAVAHCVSQHSPSPLSSPSPPSSGSGSTGRCDSVTASTISAQSPAGSSHLAFL